MIGAIRKGDLYHPTFAGTTLGVFYMGTGFTFDVTGVVNTLVPAAGADVTVWTTPSAPFLLEHAFVVLTGACTASANPGTPTVKLTLGGADLIGGAMTAWTGVNYAVNGVNRMMWGLQTDKIAGGVFTSAFPGFTSGDVGAMGGYGSFAALVDGGVNGFWNKPVKLHVSHGAGNITMNMPFRVLLIGHLV